MAESQEHKLSTTKVQSDFEWFVGRTRDIFEIIRYDVGGVFGTSFLLPDGTQLAITTQHFDGRVPYKKVRRGYTESTSEYTARGTAFLAAIVDADAGEESGLTFRFRGEEADGAISELTCTYNGEPSDTFNLFLMRVITRRSSEA